MRCFSVLWVFLLIIGYAHAENQANFSVEGTVTGSTCKVVLGDGELVNIPSKNLSQLAAPSSVAGKTAFRISVQGCATDATVYFHNDQATVNRNGRLINTVTGNQEEKAENVELEILNSKSESVNLAAVHGSQGTSAPSLGTSADHADFDFFVQYYSTGAATAGKVKSSLTFLVDSL
jgi:major type 1 subunit fimbrin (pilin)